ncbi:MAG TPA: FtsQ-type POTRA domain-containing protein, partial [Candidatus Acidoferrum sp.]|nr:FtsQ-type POTRA domain-containing protein [Candidatus Acidoferrum sp.]
APRIYLLPSLAYNGAMQSPSRIRRTLLSCLAALCALFFLLATFARAQSGPAGAFRISKITVTGQQHLSESAIIAASGLSVGQTVSLADIAAASSRLAQSGAFDNVNFRYQTQGKDLEVTLVVAESTHLLACHFDNFVWLSPADLDAALHQRVPLYSGFAPSGGAMLQAIQSALVAILKEKGVDGTIQTFPSAPAPDEPVDSMRFVVQGVSLPIHELNFPGASAVSEDALRKSAASLLGENYSMTDVVIFANASLIPLYGERGYLRAQFAEPQAKLLDSSSAAGGAVAVTIPVREGLSYAWNGAEWTGNHAFTTTDLNKLLGMKPSEVANSRKYEQGIQDINDAYSKQGYVQLVISSKPVFDDSARRVTYRISVQEGPQFRMGSLEIIGLPANTTKRLLKSWKLHPGDVFDQAYAKAYEKEQLQKILRAHPGSAGAVSEKMRLDAGDKKVNVQIDSH